MTTGGLSEGPVTLLVTDVVGSTDLQSRLGDDAARDLMRGHDVVVREAVARLGGQEIKATGDGFLVSFTSTRRALECARTIQQRLAGDGSLIRVRMGLHAGEVIEEAGDVYGAAVSATARIAARAQDGQILVSDLVRQLAGAAGVIFRELGTVQLKGLDGNWVLHEVIWREPGETPMPASTEPSTSSVVGRDSEVVALHRVVDAAIAGRGSVLLLAGEPGIGKTTLAVDAASHADRRGARVLWGACWDGEGAPAYWPWIQVLRAYTSDVDDEELATTAGPGAADVLRLLPELASRLPSTPTVPDLAPDQARFRLFDAVASMLCRAASGRPLLIVLDDLHWGDESSLLLLGFVAAQLPSNAVAVVGTYRDTEVDAGHPLAALLHAAVRRAQVLPVTGLDADAVASLMVSTAGTAVRPELTRAVHRQTGGNPFFIGEITRLLDANDALDRTEVGVGVPAGVREVIDRRMARFPQRCIELLTIAAVVGEEFPLDVVADIAGTTVTDLVEQLEVAVEGGVARPAGVGHCRFAHALLREALYEGQGTVARARLHLRVAHVLEDRSLGRREVPAAELAHHFAEAAVTGGGEKAARYARLAAAQATDALAYGEAIALYERALAVLDLVGGREGDRGDVLLELAAARFRAGDRAGARAEIDRAVEIARRTGRSDILARSALALTKLGGSSGLVDTERIGLLDEARAALGDEESALRARVLAALAQEWFHAWSDQEETEKASVLATEAVDLARRVGDPNTLAAALIALHDVQWLTGKEAERLQLATELIQTARLAGDRELATEAVLLQATALVELADVRGVGRLEEFVRQAGLLHQPHFDYLAATRRATLAMISGDVDGINRHLDEARRLAAAHEEPEAHLVEGAQAMARDTLTGSRRDSIERTRRAYTGRIDELTVVIQALVLVEDGDFDEGRRLLSSLDLDDILLRHVRNNGWVSILAMLAEAACLVGDVALMTKLESRLHEHTGKCIVVGGCVSFFGSVDHYLGLIYAAVGRRQEATAAFGAAIAAYDRLGAEGWAARTRTALEAVTRASAAAAADLRREGPVWAVQYGDREIRVKDSKGMRDLAALLSAPGQEIAAAELIARGLAQEAGADPVLDAEARARFRRRLDELGEDLAEAERANDLGHIRRLRDEREALAHELAAALGLAGRARRLGDPAERARKAVSARIRDAIQRMATEHADLGRHLEGAVRTGAFCSYSPGTPIHWRVTDDSVRQS